MVIALVVAKYLAVIGHIQWQVKNLFGKKLNLRVRNGNKLNDSEFPWLKGK